MNSKQLTATAVICVLVTSIFGSAIVLAAAPSNGVILPQIFNALIVNTGKNPVPVNITNTEPIKVKNVEESEPVQFNGALRLGSGSLANGVTFFYTVPADKLLVIQYITARVSNLDSTDSLSLEVVTSVNSSRVNHFLGLVGPQGRIAIDPSSHPDQFLAQNVKIYADPQTFVSVGCERLTRLNDVTIFLSMSGYFIDVP